MEFEYKLSIAILTMNRAEQVKNAIISCLNSRLPNKTEIIIVDNGSIDETSKVIDKIQKNSNIPIHYIKQEQNFGPSKGRNICFKLSKGEYVYFLDDDAEIPVELYDCFFIDNIDYLDKNLNVATLTTDVKDEVFGERKLNEGKVKIDGLPNVFSFHEGTVFVRKKSFKEQLYLDVNYGSEAIWPSLMVVDRGFYNVYNAKYYINHFPLINKWKNQNSQELNLMCVSNIYLIKKLIYPIIFIPLLFLAYKMRLIRLNITDRELISKYRKNRRELGKVYKEKKVKIKTVLFVLKNFGFKIF